MVQYSALTDKMLLQGLLLAWDFDQPEAKATFQLAAATDANASMPFWGIQYAVGPGANRC